MGRKGFYHVTDKLREYWQSRGDVNTITLGDMYEVDLNKQTIYPLVHVSLDNTTIGEKSLSYNLEVRFLDIVDHSKADTRKRLEVMYGNDNEQDVFHNMEAIAVETVTQFRRGNEYSAMFQVDSDPTLLAIKDSFANGIAGWQMTITINVPYSAPIC